MSPDARAPLGALAKSQSRLSFTAFEPNIDADNRVYVLRTLSALSLTDGTYGVWPTLNFFTLFSVA